MGSGGRGRAAAHVSMTGTTPPNDSSAKGHRSSSTPSPSVCTPISPGPPPHPSWRPACQSRRGAHPGRGSHHTPAWQQLESQAWAATVSYGLMQQPAGACKPGARGSRAAAEQPTTEDAMVANRCKCGQLATACLKQCGHAQSHAAAFNNKPCSAALRASNWLRPAWCRVPPLLTLPSMTSQQSLSLMCSWHSARVMVLGAMAAAG